MERKREKSSLTSGQPGLWQRKARQGDGTVSRGGREDII